VDNYQLDIMQEMQDAENQKKMMTAQELKVVGKPSNPLQVVHHTGKRAKLQWFDLETARQPL
jgi:hypothetical protein